jgi:hypothetical protein
MRNTAPRIKGTRVWADFHEYYCPFVRQGWNIQRSMAYLITSPEETCNKEDYASDGEESTNKIDLSNNLLVG